MTTISSAVRATTQAPADDHNHAVAETGPFGILTLCGQIGTAPMKPGDHDCPVCLERTGRDDVGIWFDNPNSLRTWQIEDRP